MQKNTDLLAHGNTILTRHQTLWAFGKYCEGYSQRILADCLYVHENPIRTPSGVRDGNGRQGLVGRKHLPPLKYPGQGRW